MAKLRAPLELLASVVFGLLTGLVVSLVMVYNLITKGPRKVFYCKEHETRPKCFHDAKVGNHGFVTLKSGLKLHAVTKGSTDKPLMLFLHGFPECWYSWRYQMTQFSEDYRTVAVDLRGYGESDKPQRVSDYELLTLVNDIKEVVEALGEEKCVLVAHDWGGIVGQLFAMRHPTMVTRLVLCNIPHMSAFMQHLQTAWSQKKKSWYIYFFQLPWLPEMMLWMNDYKLIERMFSERAPGSVRPALETAEEKDAFKYALSCAGGLSCPLNYYRALLRYKLPQFGTISMPTLLVFGVHDKAIDVETCELSRAFIPDMTLKYVDTATHWVQQQAPEEVNQHIADFLKDEKQN